MPFGLEQYEAMASVARSAKGAVLITLNDHPDMRRVFEGLTVRTADIRYTVGGAARSDVSSELILTNF